MGANAVIERPPCDPPARRPPGALAASVAAGVALWSATLLVAAVVAALLAAIPPLHDVVDAHLTLSLKRAPAPVFGDAIAFFVANFRHGGWVLLVAALPPAREQPLRRVVDIAIGGQLIATTTLVGAAIAIGGTDLLPFIVHLPLEWAALAVGAGGWLRARRGAPTRVVLAHLTVFSALIFAAAVVETYAVPHY